MTKFCHYFINMSWPLFQHVKHKHSAARHIPLSRVQCLIALYSITKQCIIRYVADLATISEHHCWSYHVKHLKLLVFLNWYDRTDRPSSRTTLNGFCIKISDHMAYHRDHYHKRLP